MKVIYLLLGCLVNYINSKCIELQKQHYITCYSFAFKCCIMEGDEEDFQDLRQINTQIVTKSFYIPYANEPILIRVIDSLNQNKIQEKLMCSLFVNLEYYITCMGFDLILYEEQTNYSDVIRIDTKISANEICDELFINEDDSFSLFCLGQSTLKQYSLDFQNNVTLSLEYDVSEQIEDKCKKKQIKQVQDQQLIFFYQCSRWKVILITNNQATTLIYAQMNYQQANLTSLTFIDDVVYCEINSQTFAIYLIENNFYVLVYYHLYQKKIINYAFRQMTYQIQKILLYQKCSIIMLVNELDKNDSSIIQDYQEVLLNQNYSINNIHLHSNLVFLQYQFELKVLINVRINQTYQICNTSLYFFDFNNLFCQFDQKKNVLQFYKYQPLSTFIEPKQKYVYIIQKAKLFRRDDIIYCFRVLQNNTQKQKYEFTELMKFQYNCENKQQILWNSNNSNYFKNNNYNLYTSEGNLKVSIRNNQDFQHICFSKLYKFYHQGRFQVKKITKGHISFQNESFFYIYDCQQKKIVISVNIDKYNVLEYDIAYYFVNKSNNNDLTGVQFSDDSLSYFNLHINEVITCVKKIYSSLIIYTNASNQPLIIQINYQSLVRQNYLQQNLYQPEPILFYFESQNLKFIQYSKIIAFESDEIFRCFQFQESFIISIQSQNMQKCHCIVSIQNQTRSLILYYLIDQELRQVQNYTFQNYSFYYPIKYQITGLYLAILIEQNNLLYIAIFQYSMSKLSLDEIIATDNSFFQLDQTLLLFSFDKVWKQFLLKQFQVELELENFHLNVASQTFSMIKKEEGGVELRIEIENQCFQLSSIVKSSRMEIQYNKNFKLNISEMFYGQISNLTILNNANVVLKGPFQFIKTLQTCNDQTSDFCIRQYHFEKNKKRILFEVIMQDNEIFGVINTTQMKVYYITWIKQQYFLCVSQFINDLNIELIECSEKQNQTCKMISNLNVDLKIDQINLADTMRVGNLIKLKGNNTQAIIIIDNINYNIQILPGVIIDIKYIEKSDNQYLILQKNMIDSNNLELTIYQANLNQTYSLTINEKIQAELIKIENFYQSKFTMKLVSCKYSGDLINIKLLTLDQSFSQLFQLNLNQQKNQIQLELQNQFRNQIKKIHFVVDENYIIQYVDDSLLVLQQTDGQFSQFYQIQEDRKLIDFFHIATFQRRITRLNTTHFIFNNDILVQLGLIGYELELQNYDEVEQNFELFAQNEISNEKVSFQIHIIKTNLQYIQLKQTCRLRTVFYQFKQLALFSYQFTLEKLNLNRGIKYKIVNDQKSILYKFQQLVLIKINIWIILQYCLKFLIYIYSQNNFQQSLCVRNHQFSICKKQYESIQENSLEDLVQIHCLTYDNHSL